MLRGTKMREELTLDKSAAIPLPKKPLQGGLKAKSSGVVERVMSIIFLICGSMAVISVALITLYMIISGAPAIGKVGFKEFFFGTVWYAKNEQFGILPLILTSLCGTIGAVLIGVPVGILTSIFLAEIAPPPVVKIIRPMVELLAGIPSVIYGLLGSIILKPFIASIEKAIFANDPNHTFTGGANLISAVIVLAIMILPTIVNISYTTIKAIPEEYREASYGLGATHIQTIFKVMLPAGKSGLASGVVLGVGRAIGEAMAIILVAGNTANMPALFNSVRFLTTGVVAEFSYSSGLHREVLFSIGLVLFAFIMVINIILNKILKSGNAVKA